LRPHERSLVLKLGGKPFALIGVNTQGQQTENLKEVMEKERMNWRSFADHADPGAIRDKWHMRTTPTLYVLDHKGVIRHKWVGSPGEKAIDAALEKLIKEAEGDGKSKAK
jgi:hypothetical protein